MSMRPRVRERARSFQSNPSVVTQARPSAQMRADAEKLKNVAPRA
jgi:hypothetical protein